MKISVKVTFKNYCGLYDSYEERNDWSLVGVGTTIQEAVDNIFKKENLQDICRICVDDTKICLREFVEVEGKKYYSDDEIVITNKSDLKEFGFPEFVCKKSSVSSYEYESQCNFFALEYFMGHPKKLHFWNVRNRLDRFQRYFNAKAFAEKEAQRKLENEIRQKELYLELKKKYENENSN